MLTYSDLDLAAFRRLASEFARQFKNRKVLIGLVGDLGAGKTTFVKAMAASFHIRRTSSPTFVISHEYKIPQGKMYHLDFYRLHDSKQLAYLGISEMNTHKNIVLIEWVDRFPQIQKKCDIIISLKVKKDNKRDVTIETPNHK
jgi:tRNA threonylcarbamoyladenosine biosynthesis protein TsaE